MLHRLPILEAIIVSSGHGISEHHERVPSASMFRTAFSHFTHVLLTFSHSLFRCYHPFVAFVEPVEIMVKV